MIPRFLEPILRERLGSAAAVALLGPRQVGKTTLARKVADEWAAGAIYLDLERPADRRRLDDADAYLRSQASRLVVLDEVHRAPELFGVLRGVIDDNRRAGHRSGQFLLLGSASLDLIQQSSESLAGRVSHLELDGLSVDEVAVDGIPEEAVWLRGGFPESLLAGSDEESIRWRQDFIRSYLERDVPMFAPRLPAETLHRLWVMLAHNSGGLFNASRLAQNLGVSSPTADRYVDLLVDLGLVRRLTPWHINSTKRLTKSPKVYVRDTGLMHALLEIDTMHDLRGHPSVGASFESLAVESLAGASTRLRPHHYRTATGDEVDLLLVKGGQVEMAIEVKLSTAPTVTSGFHRACDDVKAPRRYVVHPDTGGEPYENEGVTVIGLSRLVNEVRTTFGS
ncbi:MAG: ATP-binding protein [Dermatophilus congolensis]|nr:ATP-binding protein [Dermatophilus congolensis]